MSPWRLFGIALALPMLFTSFVLITVQRNRSSARAPIELTQREVSISGGDDENSGLTAWLMWSSESRVDVEWLSAAKLRSLGFDLAPAQAGETDLNDLPRQLQRRAYVVMLLGEPAGSRSRLIPVDAGLDLDQLLREYPNGRTHLVSAGVVRLAANPRPGVTTSAGGYIVTVDPRRIYVPTEHARALRARVGSRTPFTLLVRYGSHLEPWIVEVR